MIGVPFALCSENSLMPGAIFGACGNRLAAFSERIDSDVSHATVAEMRQHILCDHEMDRIDSVILSLVMALELLPLPNSQ